MLQSSDGPAATKNGYNGYNCLGPRQPINGHRLGTIGKKHLILGTDGRDAENQRDLRLSQNPGIKIVKIHRVKRDPPKLLTLIRRKHGPRVSITLE